MRFGRRLEHIETRVETKEKVSISKEAEDKFSKLMGDDFLDYSPVFKEISLEEIKANVERKFNR